jgi:23S rRNA (pseudouridine1915-N3)-methyltransferase
VTLRIIQIGKTRDNWIKEGINEYLTRLKPLIRLEISEVPDVSIRSAVTQEAVKAREAALCLKRIASDDYIVLLDERGEAKTSLEFSSFLASVSHEKNVVFVIGGVYGTHESLKERADTVLRLSSMTFTHQMARLVLIEQIYRALMISGGRSYHY